MSTCRTTTLLDLLNTKQNGNAFLSLLCSDNQLCAENKHIAKDSAYTTKRKEPTSKKRETGVSNLIVNENHPYSS